MNARHLRPRSRRGHVAVVAVTVLVGFWLSAQTAAAASPAVAPPVALPVEIYGGAGHIETVEFDLAGDPATVDQLYLQTHRLAYRDASTNPERGAKGSVRLNGGAWIELHNGNPELACLAHEAEYGCLNGAYHTVRFTVPVGGAVAGRNRLEFRFNRTEGASNGYRVLAFNLRRGGINALPVSTFGPQDPAELMRPLSAESDRTAGERLWREAVLLESPISDEAIIATCADCHASDGRDLKYFNYSNRSIVTRAQFHGLTRRQGERIATYIRALDAPAPALAQPWNPPYQPGPGLDARPAEEWAAGAGLGAVLERDAGMLPFLFPGADLRSGIANRIDTGATANVREMPISMQLPDWNDWLPEVHPRDAYGEAVIDQTLAYRRSLPVEEAFAEVDATLAAAPATELADDGELYTVLNEWAVASTSFGNKVSSAAEDAGTRGEYGDAGFVHWGGVRTWELMQRHRLEDLAPRVHGAYGEPRSWLSMRRNVFENAPHRTADNIKNLPHQSLLVGKYKSTAWYQLQLTLNSGNRRGINLWPVDWNYQPEHINGLHSKAGGPRHALRWVASHTKMLQQYADGGPLDERGPDGTAMGLRQIMPVRYAPTQGMGKLLDDLPDEYRVPVYEALLSATLDVLEQYPPELWARGEPKDNTVEPLDYAIAQPDLMPNRFGKVFHDGCYADCWYAMITPFIEAGVGPTTTNRLVDWGAVMWPHPGNDWDALRREEPAPTSVDELPVTSFQIAPNPAPIGGQVVLTLVAGGSSTRRVALLDLRGRILREAVAPAGAGSVSLDLNGLSPGAYVVEVAGEGSRQREVVLTQ